MGGRLDRRKRIIKRGIDRVVINSTAVGAVAGDIKSVVGRRVHRAAEAFKAVSAGLLL